jgi:Domain of unknown function (DUF4167)
MRPGQNKRMRGRPTNNRRGPNPLTRSYESNGPDVKIRGNAQHVAEKYLQLARDAHTGGDPVAAENYLQHAEHYFRLIAAAQAAQALAQSGQPRPAGEGDLAEFDDDDDFGGMSDRFASPSERVAPSQQQNNAFQGSPTAAPNAPQPYVERQQYEPDNRPGQNDRGGYPNRQDRQGNRFQDRGPRPERQFGERNDGYRDNRPNRDGRPREFRPYRDASPQPPREAGVEGVPATALPSFITGEPKSTYSDAENSAVPEQGVATSTQNAPETGAAFGEASSNENPFQARGRRRRLRSPYGYGARQAAEEDPEAQNANTVGDETSATE